MDNQKIGSQEAICLLITIGVAHTIISTPRDLLTSMKSAVLLNLIFVTLITIFLIFLIVKLYKKFPGADILDISEYLGGKKFKLILGIIFTCYFILSASMLLKEFAESLRTIYYHMTDVFFIVLLFVIVISITCKLNLSATIKANFIIVPFVLLSSIFLFFSNIKNFSYDRIFPVLGDGFINTFILGISNITSFSGIALFYFLPPLLKQPEKFKNIGLLSVIIFAIYLFLNVSVVLFMFSFLMSQNEILPLYSAARYIEIGTFFVRLESLFLFVWLEVFACYFCIVSKFVTIILQKITNVKESKIYAYPVTLSILGISLLKSNYALVKNFDINIYPVLSLSFIFIFCILLLIFANIKRKKLESIKRIDTNL